MIKVYINSRLKAIVNDPAVPVLIPMSRQEEIDEAWNIIGQSTFGSCHECHDKNGVMSEFICF